MTIEKHCMLGRGREGIRIPPKKSHREMDGGERREYGSGRAENEGERRALIFEEEHGRMCVTREHMEESVLSRINTSQVAPPPEPLLYDTSKANSESSFYLEPPEPLVVRSSSTPHLRSLCATPTQEKAHMRKMGVKIRK
eukprot:1372448-Amorphochlora_amoeboformis.AAC.2